jgi:hypothetical protein
MASLIVISYALGNGVGGGAHSEEPAHHFLPRANFGESAVFVSVEVDF